MTQVRLFFFFSSRRRHTRLQGDWSSDVCSSDLLIVVNEDETAVDERPEPSRPANPHLVRLHVLAARQSHREGVALLRHRKEAQPTREVNDLAMVGSLPLRHVSRSIRAVAREATKRSSLAHVHRKAY